MASENRIRQSHEVAKAPRPQLEIQSWNCRIERRSIQIQGQVKNISNESLHSVRAIGSFFTGEGDFVKYADSFIEFNPILPGQTSNFRIRTSTDPTITSCQVTFGQLFGGSIRTTTRQLETEQQHFNRF